VRSRNSVVCASGNVDLIEAGLSSLVLAGRNWQVFDVLCARQPGRTR
jgi:hypothetical protein